MPPTWGAVDDALARFGYTVAAESDQIVIYMKAGSPFLYLEVDKSGPPNLTDICQQLQEQGDNPEVFTAELESM